jgi:deoxyguanosine kinase
MIVCIEGSIGVGKTTLAKMLTAEFGGQSIFEEYENNPFLKDFYNNPDVFAFHVQTTFLCLQSKQFLKAAELAKSGNVFLDFHPIKSKVFSNIVIKDATDFELILKMYDRFFAAIEPEILIIYLHAEPGVIMNRIRQRNDAFTTNIPFNYIKDLVANYSNYFAKYEHPFISIDTTQIDFEKNEADWQFVKQLVIEAMEKK